MTPAILVPVLKPSSWNLWLDNSEVSRHTGTVRFRRQTQANTTGRKPTHALTLPPNNACSGCHEGLIWDLSPEILSHPQPGELMCQHCLSTFEILGYTQIASYRKQPSWIWSLVWPFTKYPITQYVVFTKIETETKQNKTKTLNLPFGAMSLYWVKQSLNANSGFPEEQQCGRLSTGQAMLLYQFPQMHTQARVHSMPQEQRWSLFHHLPSASLGKPCPNQGLFMKQGTCHPG